MSEAPKINYDMPLDDFERIEALEQSARRGLGG